MKSFYHLIILKPLCLTEKLIFKMSRDYSFLKTVESPAELPELYDFRIKTNFSYFISNSKLFEQCLFLYKIY